MPETSRLAIFERGARFGLPGPATTLKRIRVLTSAGDRCSISSLISAIPGIDRFLAHMLQSFDRWCKVLPKVVYMMPPPPDVREEKDLELRCVNCGWGLRRLFMQYSHGNIRLVKCENCKAIADPYIECEFMIVLIDLILHKTKAYRHLLYNMLNLDAGDLKGMLWKSSLVYFLLDACRILLLKGKGSKDDRESSGNFLLSIWTCEQVLADVILGNFVFISFLLLGTRVLLTSSYGTTRCRDILLAILVSSYFKLYLIAMLVWEFPSSVLFIVDLFVLSSNAVALRVLTQSRTTACIGVCFCAYTAKFFTSHWGIFKTFRADYFS